MCIMNVTCWFSYQNELEVIYIFLLIRITEFILFIYLFIYLLIYLFIHSFIYFERDISLILT